MSFDRILLRIGSITFFSFSIHSSEMAEASTTSTWSQSGERGVRRADRAGHAVFDKVGAEAYRWAGGNLHRNGLRQLLRAVAECTQWA